MLRKRVRKGKERKKEKEREMKEKVKKVKNRPFFLFYFMICKYFKSH